MKTRNTFLAFLLLFSSGFGLFSPHEARAAACDPLISPAGLINSMSLLGGYWFSIQPVGAGRSTITFSNNWENTDPPLREQSKFEIENGYHCSYSVGTPTGDPSDDQVYFILPSGTFPSANTSNRLSGANGSQGYRGPYLMFPDGYPGTPVGCDMHDTWYDQAVEKADPSYCPAVKAFYAANPSIDSYQVSGTLNTPWFDSSGGVSQKQKEDEAIKIIDETGHITVRSKIGTAASVPATNCVRIAGPWPDDYARAHDGRKPRKLVFMRGNSWDSSVDQFMAQVNDLVNNGMKQTDPFKKYFDHISIYVDLKKIDESRFATHGDDNADKRFDSPSNLVQSSKCTNDPGSVFVLLTSDMKYYPGYTKRFFGPVGYVFSKFLHIDLKTYMQAGPILSVLMHEFGHAFGGLEDEYIINDSGQTSDYSSTPDSRSGVNCVLFPFYAYRSNVDNKWYGSSASNETKGCKYSTSPDGDAYYRPSPDSLMNVSNILKYNVIDCGFILANILLNDDVTQAVAQTYWPKNTGTTLDGQPVIGCMGLDTIKDGIPSTSPSPSISPPASASLSQFLASPFEALQEYLGEWGRNDKQ